MDRDGIFAGDDPVVLVGRWLDEAQITEPNDPNAIALSTVDSDGAPNVRMVLLKGIEDGDFVFYTNYQSDKAAEIDHAGKAAFLFHWKSLRRQIRVRGSITREDSALADAYYQSRVLGSRLGAWASPQSKPIADRAALEARLDDAKQRYGDAPPRPPFWGGYRLSPLSIEFWAEGEHRLHNRFRWTREPGGAWRAQRLGP